MGSIFSSVAAVIHGAVFPPTTSGVNYPSARLLPDGSRPPRSEEQRDASVALCALPALAYYNSKHPGAEFDLVKPLMTALTIFRRETWYWARRRGAPPQTPVQQFFGELHDTCTCHAPPADCTCDTLVVETCSIVSKISTFQPLPPTRKKKKPRRSVCAFCPPSYETFHPKKGKFVCGKEEPPKEEFIGRLINCLELPFTCSAANESAPASA